MSKTKVIVVGAGAAGLMAAGQAALQGADVMLLEKMSRPALKLRITGKGRCNLTNTRVLREFIQRFGKNGRFLHQAFSRYFTADLLEFFHARGVETVVERGGRVFPVSGRAEEIVKVLVDWVGETGVECAYNSQVTGLVIEDVAEDGAAAAKEDGAKKSGSASGACVSGLRVKGVRVHSDGPRSNSPVHEADAVIITTGGASYPATGSSGDGYALAKSVNHTVAEIRPALVPLETSSIEPRDFFALNGLSLRNINARVWIDGKKKAEQFGEMEFARLSITGPIILTMSGLVVEALKLKKKVELSLDLKPALDEAKLDKRLIRETAGSHKKAIDILNNLLPMQLVPLCIQNTGLHPEKRANQITSDERKRLRRWLKDFRLDINAHRPIAEAIVTAGGVSLKEIDAYTMQSRLVKGLYFAGEVLDLQGDTGGYNLQAAFSTGWLAGRSVVSK